MQCNQSTRKNETQQGSPELTEHDGKWKWNLIIVVTNYFITQYIVTFKGINKPYLTLPTFNDDLGLP